MSTLSRVALSFVILLTTHLAFVYPVQAQGTESSLLDAYAREYAYLTAHKTALQRRQSEVEAEAHQKITTAQAELARLSGGLLSLTLEADRLEASIFDAQREFERAGDGEDVLTTTLAQAQATLARHGLPAATDTPELSALIAQAHELLRQGSRVRTEAGAYFLPDGIRVEGDITRVGNIAAYGIAKDGVGSGMLAPAGEGRLKLWSASGEQSARAIAGGTGIATVDIFLFESLEQNIEEKKVKTALEVVEAGGVIAWVIVALGALGLLLLVVRALTLLVVARGSAGLTETVAELVARGDFERAGKVCAQRGTALGRVLQKTIPELRASRAELDDAVGEAILHESPHIERFGTAILVFAAVAPLLGLLGTVTGMIKTFEMITEFGTGDPRYLSGGISEALITTELGLIVAIPLLIGGNLLSGQSNALLSRLERSTLTVINAARTGKVAPVRPEVVYENRSSTAVEVAS